MATSRWSLCLTATLIAATLAPDAAQPSQPRFGTSSDLVVVPAVVVDRRGRDVTTLTRDDFEVLEDGRPVAIDTFVAPDSPDAETGRYVVVVVDNVHTPPELLWRAKSLARRFVDKATDADRMAVLALSGGRSRDTASGAELRAAVDGIAPSADSDVRSAEQQADNGLDTLGELAERLVASPHRRKVMVVVGSPVFFSPHTASAFHDRGPELSPSWHDAIERLGRANVALHVIDPRGFQGRAEDFGTSFAVATGGTAWANNDAGRVVDRIWRDAGTYYLLGYRPPVNDRRPHGITVRVRTPDVTVRARRLRG